jgi:hypothetical protein
MRLIRIAPMIALVCGVAGCVLPPAVTIASLVADGLSMASTGKTITDQAISLLAHRDCRLWRLVQGRSICGSDATVVAVAALPPALPLRAASPGLRAPEPVVAAAPALVDAPAVEPPPVLGAPIPATVPPSPSSAAPGPQPKSVAAPVSATHTAPPPTAAAAPPAQPPMRHTDSDARLRGEMVIRSGTDEAEARALADDLHAVGATVRPVRHGNIMIYEVVMGLSG